MNRYVVALYIRLSIEDAKTESMSIDNQRMALRQYVDTLDETDVEILEFVDNGYSGTNFERPAVQELLMLVQSYKVDCVIVKDFSRFGRNIVEMGHFIERVFPVFRTRFISVQDDFDTRKYKGDTGGMEVAFKYLINEYYCRDLSEKSKSVKYDKMKRGEYQSKICCYGYRKGSNNRLEVDGEVAQVVKMIFGMALKNKSAQQIVQALYDRGIPTPGEYKASKGYEYHDISRSHRIWQRSAVLRILADERYIGTYVIGKRAVKEIGGNNSRLKDESEWIKIPNHHPVIIDKDLFERVQSRLKHLKYDKRQTHEYPLRGKVICGCCNHAMYRINRKEPAFMCRFTRVDSTYSCHGLEMKESELENLLFEIISKQAAVVSNIDNLSSAVNLESELTKKVSYEKQIQNCYESKRHLYEQHLRDEIDIDRYIELKSEIDAELTDLKRIYTALSFHTEQIQKDSDEKSKVLKLAKDISSEKSLTQALADTMIKKVYVYPDNHIEIAWKIKDFSEFYS